MGASSGENLLSRYWWVLVIIGCIILIMIIGIIVLARRRRKKKKRKVPVPHYPTERPYPAGGRDFHHSGYPAGPQTYQAQGQYPSGVRSGWNTGGIQSPGVSGFLPQTFQQQRPALPMHTQTSMAYSPTAPAPSLGSQEPNPPQYQQNVSPQQVLPGYTLPPISTDQGTQDLNLMALPPAPDDLPMSQAEPTQAAAQAFVPSAGTAFIAPDPFPVEAAVPPVSEPQLSVQDLFAIPEPAAPPAAGPPSIDDLFDTATLPPLPPTEQPISPPPPAAEVPVQPQSVQCHSCGAMNQVTTNERPTVITCPVCSAQGYISG